MEQAAAAGELDAQRAVAKAIADNAAGMWEMRSAESDDVAAEDERLQREAAEWDVAVSRLRSATSS